LTDWPLGRPTRPPQPAPFTLCPIACVNLRPWGLLLYYSLLDLYRTIASFLGLLSYCRPLPSPTLPVSSAAVVQLSCRTLPLSRTSILLSPTSVAHSACPICRQASRHHRPLLPDIFLPTSVGHFACPVRCLCYACPFCRVVVLLHRMHPARWP
jgi:hypothetical protein